MANRLVMLSKKKVLYPGLVGLMVLLFPVLTACGEAKVTTVTTQGVTAGPVATPSLTATAVPPAPTSTLVPTATAVPPSPTPEPLPNALLLGSKDAPWAEIVRYQAGANDRLEEIKFSDENRDSFSKLFVYTTALVLAASNTAAATSTFASNTFQLTFPTEVNKQLQAGSLDWARRADGQVLPILRDTATGQFRAIASVKALGTGSTLLASGPFIAFSVIAVAGSILSAEDIQQQLTVINKKLDEIKEYLDNDKRTRLETIWSVLNEFAGLLNQQKTTPEQNQQFQSQYQFGNLGLDPQQITLLMRAQMESTSKSYKDTNLDKKAFFFYDSDKVNELKRLLDNYQHYSSSYLTSLSVRNLAVQISTALPGKTDVPAGRLAELRKELDSWKQSQTKFYDLVEARVQELEGLWRDDKTRTEFVNLSKNARQNTEQEYARLDKLFGSSLDKITAKGQANNLPLKLVVTLDDKGKVARVSKLLNNG